MQEYAKELDLKEFDPVREWQDGDLKIQFLPQRKMSGWSSMMKYHNQYVSEGWEGLVIRKASAKYGPGKRTNDMIKIKIYNEDTFKCVDIVQGLRLYDDMVFVMETKDGKQFKAKPFGDRNQKVEYTDNFESKYKGHMGDCKFFEYSPYGIPEQPSFIAFRWDLE
jgi:DNA ligase-1